MELNVQCTGLKARVAALEAEVRRKRTRNAELEMELEQEKQMRLTENMRRDLGRNA